MALYQNLRIIKIGETRPPVIPFIDHRWRQLFLHLLSDIDLVFFGCCLMKYELIFLENSSGNEQGGSAEEYHHAAAASSGN